MQRPANNVSTMDAKLRLRKLKFILIDTVNLQGACDPPCKNGGVCEASGKCSCPKMCGGAQCEQLNDTCPVIPHSPTANVDCAESTCHISCVDGHALPDGSTELQMICKNHMWMPAHNVPAIEPICKRKIYIGIHSLAYKSDTCFNWFVFSHLTSFFIAICEDGRAYKECSQTEQSCDSVSAIESTTSTFECNVGCFCADGTVEHMGNCILPHQCPNSSIHNTEPSSHSLEPKHMNPQPKNPECTHEGQSYADGSVLHKECGSCNCEKGKWSCTNDGCTGRCEVYGDPHYKTFDGMRYDFMGKASFYLMRSDSGMDIIAENGDCPRKQRVLFCYFSASFLKFKLLVSPSFLQLFSVRRWPAYDR